MGNNKRPGGIGAWLLGPGGPGGPWLEAFKKVKDVLGWARFREAKRKSRLARRKNK